MPDAAYAALQIASLYCLHGHRRGIHGHSVPHVLECVHTPLFLILIVTKLSPATVFELNALGECIIGMKQNAAIILVAYDVYVPSFRGKASVSPHVQFLQLSSDVPVRLASLAAQIPQSAVEADRLAIRHRCCHNARYLMREYIYSRSTRRA